MPITTINVDAVIFHVTFSFKTIVDIRDAQIGEDELSDVALETPINWMPNKKATPPSVIPNIPEIANNARVPLLNLYLFNHNLEIGSKNKNKKGKRIVLANMALIPFNPIAINTVPIDHVIARAPQLKRP